MFAIGDKVVYPMHGAGVIQEIEDKEVLGRRQRYYVMMMPMGDMKVMIPVESSDVVGLRRVIDREHVAKVLEVLRDEASVMSGNWNRRYRDNLDKLKTGDIFAVAEVVRNLSVREREKGLSTGERRMLENARQILVSELVLASGLAPAQAEEAISQAVSQ